MNQHINHQAVKSLYPESMDDLFAEIVTDEEVTFSAVDDVVSQAPSVAHQKLTKFAAPVSGKQLKKPLMVDEVQWPEIIYPYEIKAKMVDKQRIMTDMLNLPEAKRTLDERLGDWLGTPYRQQKTAEREMIYQKALADFQSQPAEPQYTPDDFFRSRGQ